MGSSRRRTVLTSAFFGCAVAALAQARPAELLEPARGARLQPDTIVRVSWTSGVAAERKFDEMELVLSLDGGRSFPLRVTAMVSPAEDFVLWRVPKLPSEHAVIALRAGVGERRESESIRAVSSEFTILAGADDPPEQLSRVRDEWRTPEAAAGSPKDLPDGSLAASPDEMRAAPPPDSAAEPPGSALSEPDRGGCDAPVAAIRPERTERSRPLGFAAPSIPLRE
jgi:hypothetical protein